ncbi:MAG: excinuclease ABC subunit UvrB [Candidatus Lokiarchaeota archaeon]|nr:excinuclease ABC subunit UvrB [Candidatus Lokiarchaeota archaeon]
MKKFRIHADYSPTGDQPAAIKELVDGLNEDRKYQTLLGVTGSGKTFAMANIIERIQRPTLILSHNKTLAAQLYREFKEYFPENAVEYFVSYYDYYQPEAYIPHTDTYIEKETDINKEIEKMRLSATVSLLSRRDVIIIASVSCIYGLGSPENFRGMVLFLQKGDQNFSRRSLIKKLIEMQYERNDFDFARGKFRVRGDIIDIFPGYYSDKAVRVELFGDEIERISEIDTLKGEILDDVKTTIIYPARHYVIPEDYIENVLKQIKKEMQDQVEYFKENKKYIEAQRIEEKVKFDIEMIKNLGYCSGIENYSVYFSNRKRGEAPYTLLDYFPKDYILFIDESHESLPQLRGQFFGDASRKDNLIKYGFRLPSARDNRPLNFEEFIQRINQIIFVSATPGEWELENSKNIAELIVRPTGLLEPKIIVKPAKGQVDDTVEEVKKRVQKKERVLVTTLTKRMAEELTDYLRDLGINARYLHSEINTIERTHILRELRLGTDNNGFDVLVGINLLREGLDLPEVSLVCILDADKVGFLRSEMALIQTSGRASRNLNGEVIMYADSMTTSMKAAIDEIDRRRKKQIEYNKKHNIVPRTIIKPIQESLKIMEAEYKETPALSREDLENIVFLLENEMKEAADNLEFEKAAIIRDRIKLLKSKKGKKTKKGTKGLRNI